MGISIDGNSITITNATLEIVNAVNEETGVSYIIITPDGGVGSLPFLAQGLPGQPTLFPSITYVQHPDGEALPTPNPEKVLVDAGGAGLPAKYNLVFHGNAGPDGIPGVFNIASAADLADTPALGVGTDKFVLVYRASDNKFVPTAPKVGDVVPSGTIALTASSATVARLLSTINLPPVGYDYKPIVAAQTTVVGSDGAQPTRVDLFARLNDASGGHQLGYGKGLVGANALGIPTILIPTFLHNTDSTYGKVLAGNSADVHLRAEQVNPSSSNWSTPASPITTFSVFRLPV